MPKSIVQYNLLISCPGDIREELKIIEEVVAQFNEQFSDVLSMNIRTKHWAKSSYPQSGDKPQNLLNKQFVQDCDAAIAIFWTRFGTPTDEYGSGTEEEIEEMIEASKQVFMYFSEKPQSPAMTASLIGDYSKVQSFKEKYKDKGLYYTYSSNEEFRKQFLAHLSLYFLSLQKVEEIKQQKYTKLSVKVINGNSFADCILPICFDVSNYISMENSMNEIKNLYAKIAGSNISKNYSLGQFGAVMYSRVEIKENEKVIIKSFAEQMKIEIPDSFFALGSLKKSSMSVSIDGSVSVEGEFEEREKYRDIRNLYKKIMDYVNWFPFTQLFKDLKCVKLAVLNEGTTFDEDIEISLKFPCNMIIQHKNLPNPDTHTLEFLLDDCSLYEIFGISETAIYNDYESSKRPFQFQPNSPSLPSNLYTKRNYLKEYLEELDDVFEYSFFEYSKYVIVKLHVAYLKHNSAVAFPTVIFVTDDLSDVSYTITSKYKDIPVNGVLKA
ncbi:MAG: hypothetical protein ABFD25_00110 [Clostridiaceae bacterium]